ncbi:Zn-dependent hydrolase [Vogesella facilis]|uniref:Zn-dependent hydrolase n=1 Tax=Vogesella facilis TaxID=1655232 RepID=A0ABV7RCH0_9NEIS
MSHPHHPALHLDGDTLLRQIQALGDIGRDENLGGRTRIAYTDAEKAGRDQLVRWMQQLDLSVQVDQIGNIFGTLPAANGSTDVRPLMLGSHIDTVQNAGALDGCYGVLAGLAVQRAYRQAGQLPARPITVAAFSNEEGVRFQPDMMGSLVHAGGLALQEALDSRDSDGIRLGDELQRIGYAGTLAAGSIVPHEYLELHIEQGPVLEAEGIAIGAVANLQGISWQQLTIRGKANHAGTTPLQLRHDAGWAAASIVTFVREWARQSGSTLATVGSLRFEPNLINVIPRQAVLTVDLRDPDESRLQQAEQALREFIAELEVNEQVSIHCEQLARFEPVHFTEPLVAEIERAARQRGLSCRRMTSGAGHDAQMIARITPAAMIFVPSRGGISHNPREHTDDAQLLQGAQLLLDVVARRLLA